MSIRSTLLAFSLLICPAVWAQFDSAAVVGAVRDEQGAPLSAALVTLRNNDTGIAITATTGESGEFAFPTVRIGTYHLTAEAKGFAKGSAENVTVSVNARQRVDFTLKIGQVNEVVNVDATVPLLETDNSSKGQVIATRQMVELPLQGRTYSSLALLAPGVRQSQVGNQGSIAFRREGSYNVNGLRSVWNNFLLDGVDNNFYGTTNQGFSNQSAQPSPDSVAEFRMVVNAYSAEFGRSGGAVMNVASKSGGNKFHGSAWEFLQNEKLNATGFFKPVFESEAPEQAESVRRYLRRPHCEGPDVLLCRLRRIALAAGSIRAHLAADSRSAQWHSARGRPRTDHLH
ncbi:MAG: carboxypeptidase-like regulatory domain-containing protein [Paludibaculum sp.]